MPPFNKQPFELPPAFPFNEPPAEVNLDQQIVDARKRLDRLTKQRDLRILQKQIDQLERELCVKVVSVAKQEAD